MASESLRVADCPPNTGAPDQRAPVRERWFRQIEAALPQSRQWNYDAKNWQVLTRCNADWMGEREQGAEGCPH